MPRNGRNGRLYFYFSTDFFADRKIKILKARYGADGITLYIYLLCEIYREEGYFLQYDEDAKYIIAAELNMNYEKIGQILNFLLERSLFDNTLFQSDKVLTSREIQITFQDAVKAMASKNPVLVNKRLWLLKKDETAAYIQVQSENEISEKLAPFSEKSAMISEKSVTKQSKVKQSKVKKSKAAAGAENENAAVAAQGIEKAFTGLTGRNFSHADRAALDELHGMGAGDGLILGIMNDVSKRRHSAVSSMRYFIPIVREALTSKAIRCPETSGTDEIEAILDAEWEMECGSLSGEDYDYDD